MDIEDESSAHIGRYRLDTQPPLQKPCILRNRFAAVAPVSQADQTLARPTGAPTCLPVSPSKPSEGRVAVAGTAYFVINVRRFVESNFDGQVGRHLYTSCEVTDPGPGSG